VRLADGVRIVREVAAAVGLAEGESEVRAVATALARLEPISTRRLSRAVGLPVPIVASVCGELRKRHVVAEERPAQLTALGRELFAAGALRLSRPATCPRCRGRTVVVPNELARVLVDVGRIARVAPPPRYELDQCHCTPETKLQRVLALHEADALVGRRILLLGDDDLVSVAVARLVGHFGSAATVAGLTVLDVDADLVAFLGDQLVGASFPVSCVRHDLREPLPTDLRRAFGTVVMDPPYTLDAARLFLSRAVDALAPGGGDVFLSFGSRRTGAAFELQQLIVDAGLLIRRLLPDFNEYLGAGVLGGSSHLYHLRATAATRPLVSGRFDGPLYTRDSGEKGTARAAVPLA
jgi:predicted methyltransferase